MSKRSKANEGRSGAIRQTALKGAGLSNMERHGKREDESGQRRSVRETAPLVFGSLDIVERCSDHLEGVQRSAGSKTQCIHALVQFPTQLIDAKTEKQQQLMLDHAVKFINKFHGGDAVFAARLDRDEKGRHSVDVFAMPRYEHKYKDGRVVTKASASKFSKEQALKRVYKLDKTTGEAVLDADGKRVGRSDPRAQGTALQMAWFEYMRDEMQIEGVMAPERKKFTTADRVEPEVHALRKDRKAHSEKQIRDNEFFIKTDRIIRERSAEADKKMVEANNRMAEADRKVELIRKAAIGLQDRQDKFDLEKKAALPALAAARANAVASGNQDKVEELSMLQKSLQPERKSGRVQQDFER